jgi:hypothetical protein
MADTDMLKNNLGTKQSTFGYQSCIYIINVGVGEKLNIPKISIAPGILIWGREREREGWVVRWER